MTSLVSSSTIETWVEAGQNHVDYVLVNRDSVDKCCVPTFVRVRSFADNDLVFVENYYMTNNQITHATHIVFDDCVEVYRFTRDYESPANMPIMQLEEAVFDFHYFDLPQDIILPRILQKEHLFAEL